MPERAITSGEGKTGSGLRHILVAGPDDARLALILGALPPACHADTMPLAPPDAVLARHADNRYDLLILDCPDVDDAALAFIRELNAQRPVAILVFASAADAGRARAAVQAGVTSFVVDGLAAGRIQPLVEVAMERFRLTDALYQELQRSKEDLAARKIIEQAKGLLMERRGVNEREAYESMRRMAMAQGKTVRAIAETILSVSDLFP